MSADPGPARPAEGSAVRIADLRLLVPALVAWATCAAVVSMRAAPLVIAATGALVAAAALARTRWRFVGSLAPLTLAALSPVLLACAAQTMVRDTGSLGRLAADHAVVDVVGTVTSDPVLLSAGRPGGATVRLQMRLDRVDARGVRVAVAAPVLVVAPQTWQSVRWHQQVRSRGKLVPAMGAGDGAVATFRPSGDPRVVRAAGPVPELAERVRAGLRAAATPLPADARGLLPALVIGDTSRTPPDLTEAMRATGMTHLSAVSGSNVAIVVATSLGACRLLGVRRRWRPFVAGAVLAGFVVLARPEPSVIRAATMGGIGLIGMSRSRRAAGIPVLSAAVLVLLVVDPWLSRSYGFALSTLATLGLLLFARPWGEAIGRRLPRRIASWGPAIAIPVAAQAVCGPVIVLLQGSVSLVGVVANLLAAPLVAPATLCGVAAAVVAPLWRPGSTALCWLGAVPSEGIAWVARTCAKVPGGNVPWPGGAPGALLLATLTVLLLLSGQWWWFQARRHPRMVIALGLLVGATSAPTVAFTWPPPGWRMVACEVGQGDALVLATVPGHAVLVDAGPDPVLVDGCLRRLHVAVLDAIVLTHFHADHVDGLPGALNGRPVREILASPVREPPYQWREVERWAGARRIPVRNLYAGDRLRWAGVSAQVWWPAREIHAGSVPNNASVVMAVQSGSVDLLLLGDVEREAAHAVLLAIEADPTMSRRAQEFDVVKAPHHGSANLDEGLMRLVRSPAAVISVGRHNDYGHPSPKALAVLRADGYAIFRTDLDGDVAVVDDAGQVKLTRRGA